MVCVGRKPKICPSWNHFSHENYISQEGEVSFSTSKHKNNSNVTHVAFIKHLLVSSVAPKTVLFKCLQMGNGS